MRSRAIYAVTPRSTGYASRRPTREHARSTVHRSHRGHRVPKLVLRRAARSNGNDTYTMAAAGRPSLFAHHITRHTWPTSAELSPECPECACQYLTRTSHSSLAYAKESSASSSSYNIIYCLHTLFPLPPSLLLPFLPWVLLRVIMAVALSV